MSRRVAALPKEVADWQKRCAEIVDLQAHHSQLQALSILLEDYFQKQRELLSKLLPEGDTDEFRSTGQALIDEIVNAQRVWAFFRNKLELRFSDKFKEPLWLADAVAWDCYRPVLDRAINAKMLDKTKLRAPPLTYLGNEFSPLTWVSGSRPPDGWDYAFGNVTLPIPVIEVPSDHLENLWEFLTIHHEVGHDLEADLKLREPLLARLRRDLASVLTPPERLRDWISHRHMERRGPDPSSPACHRRRADDPLHDVQLQRLLAGAHAPHPGRRLGAADAGDDRRLDGPRLAPGRVADFPRRSTVERHHMAENWASN